MPVLGSEILVFLEFCDAWFFVTDLGTKISGFHRSETSPNDKTLSQDVDWFTVLKSRDSLANQSTACEITV